MSHISIENNELYQLKEVLENIRKNNITEEDYCNICDIITPRSNGVDLVDYLITDKIDTAAFLPSIKLIVLNVSSLDSFIEKSIDEISEYNNEVDELELRPYVPFWILFHEMEHAYQYLFSKDLIDMPYNIVKEGYYHIFKYLDGSKNNKFIKYLYNQTREKHLSILERNAQIESFDLCSRLANYENNESMKKLFAKMKRNWYTNGYVYSKKGGFYETYKNTFLFKEYWNLDKSEDITIDEKVRYGLEIDEYTRAKILTNKY